MQKYLFVPALIIPLAACDVGGPAQQTSSVGGKTFSELKSEYPDMGALDFPSIDTNRDGIVDAEEEAAGDFDF